MDMNNATRALAALAQDTRLAAFRTLVRAGRDGMLAGDIARALAVPHNTLSTHLSSLAQAGLVYAEREGRCMRYRVDLAAMRSLLGYLVEDCCGGAPELCGLTADGLLGRCADDAA